MKIQLALVLLTVGMLFSCEQKVKTIDNDPSATTSEKTEAANDFMQFPNAQKIAEIEEHINTQRKAESLRWEKETKKYGFTFTEVEAYFNEDGIPMKIIEYFVDGNYQPQGERIYYLENNKVIAFMVHKDVWVDSSMAHYYETRTVYDENGPALTQTRNAFTYEDIEDAPWTQAPTETASLDKVSKILSGEGEFQTYFISVVEANNLFLLLGEPKPNSKERYTTPVRVDEITPFIEDLVKNKEKYKFRPVHIEFKVVGGNNEPEFRVLTAINWKD